MSEEMFFLIFTCKFDFMTAAGIISAILLLIKIVASMRRKADRNQEARSGVPDIDQRSISDPVILASHRREEIVKELNGTLTTRCNEGGDVLERLHEIFLVPLARGISEYNDGFYRSLNKTQRIIYVAFLFQSSLDASNLKTFLTYYWDYIDQIGFTIFSLRLFKLHNKFGKYRRELEALGELPNSHNSEFEEYLKNPETRLKWNQALLKHVKSNLNNLVMV